MKKYIWFLVSIFLALQVFSQEGRPKNIIVMIGDGMGFEHVATSMFFQGKTNDNIWKSFPVKLAAATYNESISYDPVLAWSDLEYVRMAYTESAAAATAIATGKKTAMNHIGTDKNGNHLLNLVQLSKFHGKASGIVTSVQFCHATPAGFTAHNASRINYSDIAMEMILMSKADVIMGCGHPFYDDNGFRKSVPDYKYVHSQELFDQLQAQNTEFVLLGKKYPMQDITGDFKPDAWTFGDSRSFLMNVIKSKDKPDRLFFLAPVYETLTQQREGLMTYPYESETNKSIPLLKEMTEAALSILLEKKNGFFLIVEGGAIDWASHDNNLPSLIEEMIYFEETVELVIEQITKKKLWDETLLIVMSDHECGYLTGSQNSELNFVHVGDKGSGNLPVAYFLSNDHTNHLVPFYAMGKGCEMFVDYAVSNDPVRGRYLHISNVFDVVKHFWGDAAVAYSRDMITCKGNECSVSVVTSIDDPSYLWFVNGQVLKMQNKSNVVFSPEENCEVYCIVSNSTKTMQSNPVKISVETCE